MANCPCASCSAEILPFLMAREMVDLLFPTARAACPRVYRMGLRGCEFRSSGTVAAQHLPGNTKRYAPALTHRTPPHKPDRLGGRTFGFLRNPPVRNSVGVRCNVGQHGRGLGNRQASRGGGGRGSGRKSDPAKASAQSREERTYTSLARCVRGPVTGSCSRVAR